MADDAPASRGQTLPAAAPDKKPANPDVAAVAAIDRDRSAAGTPAPGTGTATPAMSELPPDQVEYSLKVSLADLCARAAALYAHKRYDEAAEVYARASEMQAEMNGEMDPENAEILFLYGRALFKVGQSKSDVLGGKAPDAGVKGSGSTSATKPAAEKKAEKEEQQDVEMTEAPATAADKAVENVAAVVAQATAGKDGAPALEAKKPLFQFTGDENFDDSDEEGEGEAEEEEEEEEEDDLAVAFQVLEVARVLFGKQLQSKQEKEAEEAAAATPADAEAEDGAPASEKKKGKQPAADEEAREVPEAPKSKFSPELRHIMERLADTHDLLAEISLENERYHDAISDSRESLNYKKQLVGEDSEIIAEAHFKLSLALEFASVTTTSEEAKEKGESQQIDQGLRDEAAAELEAAIASTRLKLQNKEVELATLHSPEDNESTRKQIAEVKDIIADMEQRLVDLRKPPVDMHAALNGPGGELLAGMMGQSSADVKARFQEAKKTATDLTGLVRRKGKDEAAKSAPGMNGHGNGKRKAEESVEEGTEPTADAKKPRKDGEKVEA